MELWNETQKAGKKYFTYQDIYDLAKRKQWKDWRGKLLTPQQIYRFIHNHKILDKVGFATVGKTTSARIVQKGATSITSR